MSKYTKYLLGALFALILSITMVCAECVKSVGACRISDLNKTPEPNVHSEFLSDTLYKPLVKTKPSPQKPSASEKNPDFKKFIISLLKSSG